MSNAQIDHAVEQLHNSPIPNRQYFNLNRTALRDALKKYWCVTPLVEMANVIRAGLNNSHSVPDIATVINGLRAISVNSAEGNVFLGGVQHIDKLVVVKYNKPESDAYAVKREYIIGSLLNTIRARVCNFNYTYTTLSCSAVSNPVKGESGKLCDGGAGTSRAQHTILEYVDGSLLGDMIGSLSAQELGKIYLCIFCAMAIANQAIGFCHYDLHGNNVMIRTEPRPVTLVYALPDNSTISVNTRYVPVIIDYGFARAQHGDLIFAGGVGRIVPLPGRETESHPYVDWYKLIAHGIATHVTANRLTPEKVELFRVLLTSFANRFVGDDGERLRRLTVDPTLPNLQEVQGTWYYPNGMPARNVSFMDCIEPLRRFADERKVAVLKCISEEEFLSKIYPAVRVPCGGEDGARFDKNGVYRTIFDCAKYFFDGRYNVVEFQTGMTIYHGSPGLTYFNSEFPLGVDYYSNAPARALTAVDREELKNNRNVEEIMKRVQPIGLSYYGDLDIASVYSAQGNVGEFRCGNKCRHAYKFTKNAVFLDLSDTYTLRQLLDIMTPVHKFLFTLYHGERYTYTDPNGVEHRIGPADEASLRMAISAFSSPDNPQKAHFRQFAGSRVNDWISKFFDTMGILPTNPQGRLLYALQHGLVINIKIPNHIRQDPDNPMINGFPNYTYPPLLEVELSNPQSVQLVVDAVLTHANPVDPSNARAVREKGLKETIFQQSAAALQEWISKYPNAPTPDSQIAEMSPYNRYHPIKRFMGRQINHDSMRLPDYVMPKLLMEYAEKLGYAGYAYIQTGRANADARFGEIVMGTRVKSYIKRDYTNPNDWQFNDDRYVFGTIGKLIKDLKKYKTTNIDFHAGDLLEHSVWTALYMQWMFRTNHPAVDGLHNPELRRVLLATAFLHDIGKGGDAVYTYYDKVDHPTTGYNYIRAGNYTTANNGVINLNDVLREMGIAPQMVPTVAFLVRFHWDIGDILRRNPQSNDMDLAGLVAARFGNMCRELNFQGNTNEKQILFAALYALWSADVMASQPFIGKDKLMELTRKIAANEDYAGYYMNEYLEEFPYIANLPKIHRGGDKYREFGIQDYDVVRGEYANTGKGIRLRNNVIQLIR